MGWGGGRSVGWPAGRLIGWWSGNVDLLAEHVGVWEGLVGGGHSERSPLKRWPEGGRGMGNGDGLNRRRDHLSLGGSLISRREDICMTNLMERAQFEKSFATSSNLEKVDRQGDAMRRIQLLTTDYFCKIKEINEWIKLITPGQCCWD